MSRQEDIERLIVNYSRRLQKLKEQEAFSGISADPAVKLEIEDIEAKIRELQRELDSIQLPKNASAVRHNLEREPPYFFGHERTLELLVRELLERNQVIILKGFGGIGKSSLAKKIAHRYLRRGLFEMIVWVDVRRYRETQLINLNTVLDIIARVHDPNSVIVQLGDLQQKANEVIRILSQHAALIIFDNFESVIHDREGSDICGFIDRLPITAPSGASQTTSMVRVIITTRELSDDLARLQPRIHTVTELNLDDTKKLIDRKLDDLSISLELKDNYPKLYRLTCGIPKLIEFAVGQIRYLSFDQIHKGFDFHPPLERSDEIYNYLFRRTWEEILAEGQKRILMGMTFFVEHAPSEAIATTAGTNASEFAKCIKSLCDMSLLDVNYYDSGVAYKIHPLTQKMCETQASEAPDFAQSAAKRFVEFYLQYSKSHYRTSQALMEREVKNIIAATEVAQQLAEWELLIDFRDSINHFMWLAGYWPERVAANKSILYACRQAGNESLEARVLVEDLGFTYLRFEDLKTAEEYVNVGLRIYQRLNDERGIALATRHLGKSALLKGEYELVEPGRDWQYYFQQSLELYTNSLSMREKLSQSDPKEEVAIADLELDFGRLYWLWGRKCERDGRKHGNSELIHSALELYNKSMSASERGKNLFQKHENLRGFAKALGNLGNAVKQKGLFYLQENQTHAAISEFNQAHRLYEESLETAQRINKIDEIAHAKWGLAEIYELDSDIPRGDKKSLDLALSLAEASNQLYRRMATPADIQETQKLLERIRSKHKQMNDSTPSHRVEDSGRNNEENTETGLSQAKHSKPKKGAEPMLEAAAVPILVKAVDFLFDESRKILQERRERRQAEWQQEEHAESFPSKPTAEVQPEQSEKGQDLSKKDAEQKPADSVWTKEELLSLKLSEATWSAYEAEIQHLIELKRTYTRNYQLAKEQYAKWTGSLVPPIVVHNLEEAEKCLIDTMKHLRGTLSKLYGKSIIVPDIEDDIR